MQQSVKRSKQSQLLRAQTPGQSLTRVYLKTEGSETDEDFPFSKVANNFKSQKPSSNSQEVLVLNSTMVGNEQSSIKIVDEK